MKNIKEILLSRGCPAQQVDTITAKIEKLSPQLKPSMYEWLEHELMPVVDVDGYTTAAIMEKFKGMQYPAAILLLDWFLKDPETAKQAINKGMR